MLVCMLMEKEPDGLACVMVWACIWAFGVWACMQVFDGRMAWVLAYTVALVYILALACTVVLACIGV